MLPSRREHRFPKISVSADNLDSDLEITSGNDPQETPMALKTRPKPPKKRSQTLSKTLFRRLRGSLGGLLGELSHLERPRDGPGAVLVPFGSHFPSF